MTLWQLMHAGVRRWYVLLLGASLTAGALALIVLSPGVYFAQVDVVFLRPGNQFVPNALSVNDGSVIQTASVVQRAVTGTGRTAHVVSPGVTIVDEGIRRGVNISLPNSGGQWANNFDRAVLKVEVVDTTAARAHVQLQQVLAAIANDLEARQRATGADPDAWIQIQLSPSEPAVAYLEGPRKRALVMAVVLGFGVTVALLVALESRARRGRHLGRVAVTRPHRRLRRATVGVETA